MSDSTTNTFAKTRQTITVRLIEECRRTYGADVDDVTIETWVASALGGLLTEQTRVTQFVSVLAMRDIREYASLSISDAA